MRFFCCPARERKDGSIGTKPMMPEFFFKEEREEYSDGNECWEAQVVVCLCVG